MLTEVTSYYAQLQYEQAASNAIVFSLSFDESSSFLASGTSVGHLTIHAASVNRLSDLNEHGMGNTSPEPRSRQHGSTLCKFDLSCDGAVNALTSNSHSLYIATDSALRIMPWKHAQTVFDFPKALVKDTQTNSLVRLQRSDIILAVTARGTILQVDPRCSTVDSIIESEPSLFSLCLSASPADDHTILMGCDEGYVLQYDLRRADRVARSISIANSGPRATTLCPQATSIAYHPEGVYALICWNNRVLSTIHVPSGQIAFTSPKLPFVPQVAQFVRDAFYIGISDLDEHPCGDETYVLPSIDILGKSMAPAPVSVASIYALATTVESTSLAAAGFSPPTSPLCPKRLIDVFATPPLKSFTLPV